MVHREIGSELASLSALSGQVLKAGFTMHSALGPGLPESAYLEHELRQAGLVVDCLWTSTSSASHGPTQAGPGPGTSNVTERPPYSRVHSPSVRSGPGHRAVSRLQSSFWPPTGGV